VAVFGRPAIIWPDMQPDMERATWLLAVFTGVLALCALGGLCLSFWKAPKPVGTKLAILRVLVELTCAAAVITSAYLLAATDRFGLASLLALYVFLIQYAIFVASPTPLLARKSLQSSP